ncbi:MAG: UDP-2,3-diacylglucosamine diphosphatase LpxI [Hyphomicrobiaceae bacterium]|nr:UDP-2,3-diacylglucosamine diphosphatase LpxI [Hyphomicrobiaceae bacterium]
MGRTIGILAGGGQLPALIADSVIDAGGAVHIVGLKGEADAGIERFPHTWANWGEVGLMLDTLRDKGGGEVVIAGTVSRPDLFKIRPDLGFFRLLPELLRMLRGGDDSVLRRVVRLLERRGLTVLGAHEVAPALLAGAGQLGARALDAQGRADAVLGFAVRQALGSLDAGQAVAVADGVVLAIEGAEGTDRMLGRIRALARGRQGEAGRGILAKGPKPGQELRVDMPVIGMRTIDGIREAGLAGVALEAGGVLLLDREPMIRKADAGQCALVAFDAKDLRAAAGAWLDPPWPAAPGPAVTSGRVRPAPRHGVDIDKGLKAVMRLQRLGTGRSVVVARAFILAVEAAEGIVATLRRIGQLRQWGLGGRRAGVLAVRAAAGDGLAAEEVLGEAARQGLAGVAVVGEAGALHGWREATATADGLGLFLLVHAVAEEGA